MNGAFLERRCFLFRFFCRHKIKIPTSDVFQRPTRAYIFKRFIKCSQLSSNVCFAKSVLNHKKISNVSHLFFLYILLFFANNTTNKSNEMTTTLTNISQKKKKSSSVLMVLFSILRTCALALITFPIAFVLHVFAVFLLPWEITKATASEIFSHHHSMKKTKTKTNDDSDDSDDDDECVERETKRVVTISRAFRRILENGNGFTIKALFLDDASKPPTSNTTHTSLKFFQEQHKYVVEELKFQVEEAESRFRASVQKIRESEIQRVKLNEKLQETARKLARASGKDVRVSQSSKTHYGSGSKREYEDDRNSSHGGNSSAEMFATGCLCAYYLYCFYDVEDPFKFDRKMATLVPLFWVACLAVNSNGVNKLATVANLILTGYFGALVYTNQRTMTQ